MEKLKAREQIMFFDEVLLFEDELHDHGVSMISVKIVSAACMSQLILQIQMKSTCTNSYGQYKYTLSFSLIHFPRKAQKAKFSD